MLQSAEVSFGSEKETLTADLRGIRLGEALNQATRSEDFVGRLAGAEFVLVAPEIQSDGLSKLLNRLKTQVCQLDYRFDGTEIDVELGYGASSRLTALLCLVSSFFSSCSSFGLK